MRSVRQDRVAACATLAVVAWSRRWVDAVRLLRGWVSMCLCLPLAQSCATEQENCISIEGEEPPTLDCGGTVRVTGSDCEEVAPSVLDLDLNHVKPGRGNTYAEFWRVGLAAGDGGVIPVVAARPVGEVGDCSIRPDRGEGTCCEQVAATQQALPVFGGEGFWHCVPTGCFTYAVNCDSRGVSVITTQQQFLDFLQPVDTAVEAAIAVSGAGFSWRQGARVCETDGSLRMGVEQTLEDCPRFITQRLLVEVSPKGAVTVVEAEVPRVTTDAACAIR